MNADQMIRSFIQAINDHDVDRIVGLCAQDHRFVDAHGGVVTADRLRAAWSGYFAFMPHYGIEVEEILGRDDLIAVFGFASGGLNAADPADRAWRRPCAWRARVRGGLIQVWQVYVDTKAVFDLL